MSDSDFNVVRPGALCPFPCSPKMKAEKQFRGLRITAPRRASSNRMIVCGGYRLDGAEIPHDGFTERVYVVAASVLDDRLFIGAAISDLGEPAEDDDDEPSLVRGDAPTVIVEYFNVELGEHCDVPRSPGEYFVYAFGGSWVSNILRMSVVAS